jgi:hypothetical protein
MSESIQQQPFDQSGQAPELPPSTLGLIPEASESPSEEKPVRRRRRTPT